MRRLFRGLLALVLLPVAFVLLAFALHPYFSVNAPSGAAVAVVEGWIPPDLMPQVKQEIEQRGYSTVYTTGTIRPFSYWLKEHDAITVELPEPMEGGVRLVAAGLPGAQLLLLADADTLMVRQVTGTIATYLAQLTRPVRTLRLLPLRSAAPPGADVLFVKELAVRGVAVHGLHRSILIQHGDSTSEPGWPTYAHHAARRLRELGLVHQQIIPVPAVATELGRTWGNAEAFAGKAQADGVTTVDVISMGVHARRSRTVFQKAAGGSVRVGVIALPDPEAPPESWWRTRIGWIRLFKEMAGLPMARLVEGE
jgi:hypothetical protein